MGTYSPESLAAYGCALFRGVSPIGKWDGHPRGSPCQLFLGWNTYEIRLQAGTRPANMPVLIPKPNFAGAAKQRSPHIFRTGMPRTYRTAPALVFSALMCGVSSRALCPEPTLSWRRDRTTHDSALFCAGSLGRWDPVEKRPVSCST